MDHALFVRSIMAITPWFSRFAELGNTHADKPAGEQLRILRPMGMACEQAMYAATNGVNTHKGAFCPWFTLLRRRACEKYLRRKPLL